jgi:hypothetical protein
MVIWNKKEDFWSNLCNLGRIAKNSLILFRIWQR